MNMIKKTYVDIEIAYRGKLGGKDYFRDYKNFFFALGGIISILKKEIDIDNKIIKELSFDQIEFPNIWNLVNGGLLDIGNDELLITWNGRNFNIPILINHIIMEKGDDIGMDKTKQLSNRDRDLIDICLKRGLTIKGGLMSVCNRCGIDLQNLDYFNKMYDIEPGEGKEAYQTMYFSTINFEDDDGTIEENRDDPNWKEKFDKCTKTATYRRYAEIARTKSEAEVRVLPLLEEKLGLLYNTRVDEDSYHHNWR